MRFFIDTADTGAIRHLSSAGLVDGVTTNPSLIHQSGRQFLDVIAEICDLVHGPVSAEVTAPDTDGMLKEAEQLIAIANNVVIKLPLTWDGLKACRALSDNGVETNVTLCFSANQALLAAKSGACYISPFIGRLDDLGVDGMALIRNIRTIYDNYGFQTEILAASIRTPAHVEACALARADIVTAPPAILQALASHKLTDSGLEAFIADWQRTGQSIL